MRQVNNRTLQATIDDERSGTWLLPRLARIRCDFPLRAAKPGKTWQQLMYMGKGWKNYFQSEFLENPWI